MVDKIHIKNFKCLKDNAINFRNLTVLAGTNSVGKSSVIQALLLSKITIEKLIQFSQLAEAFKKNKKIEIPLNGKYLLNLGNTLEVLSRDVDSNIISFSLYNHQSKSEMFFPLIAEDNKLDSYNLELHESWINKNSFQDLQEEFYYLNAERLGPRLTYDVEQQEFENVGYQGEYAIQVLAQNKENQIVNFEKRGYSNIQDPKLISQVRAWMSYIIPDFYIDIAELEGKLKKAHTTYSKSSPTNVGFGISYVLPIVVNGLIAKENSLFIVENPEAHLHPKGQSNIGYFLAQLSNSGLQVVIETHSEHVINGIRRAAISTKGFDVKNILFNFFSKEIVKEINVLNNGDLDDFPIDFFDQTRQDLLEILKLSKR
ncbi:AAA family ATPase [Flavobacterium sp. MR2016-29]|uniref:AAA family ATPase n=1 Tax=Flavobacterium sp. MR2016-29 TaxID=2783795 RepID=UPI00188C68AA|nr:AAA family ATPase [Flavobacterium sp. MR2016-29]MBF4493187.1 AAA family ATPase [Flavobacterium sp. MR2016-29]